MGFSRSGWQIWGSGVVVEEEVEVEGGMCGCLGGKRLAAPPHHAPLLLLLLLLLLRAFTRGNVVLLPQPPLGERG